MAVIALYSVKGGVGKTTLAANLAWCSASISCRETLLWDLDAAGGSGFLYGITPHQKREAASIFSHERDIEKLINQTGCPQLDLLPADESLRSLDRQLVRIGKRRWLAKMASRLEKRYDRIVLDCPPVLNELSRQILRAADIVIVPLPPSPLSHRAFDIVATEVKRLGDRRPSILPVFSMIDRRKKLHRDALASASTWPVVPLASAFEHAAQARQPVGVIAPSSVAAHSIASLWTAIERKLAER